MTDLKITGIVVLEKNGFIQMQVRTPSTRKGYYVEASVPKDHGAEAVAALVAQAEALAKAYKVEMESQL